MFCGLTSDVWDHSIARPNCLRNCLVLFAGRSLTPLADVERYQIEDLIKMGVKDLELYRTALTSPSALPLEKIVAASFDRLEFLGDAVVNLAFRSWVYAR